MKAFRYVRPRNCVEAVKSLAEAGDARLHAGGCDLLGRLKERVDEPDVLVGLVDARGMHGIELEEDGSVRIGARTTLAEIAASPLVSRFVPTLGEAAGDAASPQLRNRATLAGNLAQHTRCGYYRHESFPCLKRGGDACPVREDGAVQEFAGIVGNGTCASAHPSSVAPVLGSLDADIIVYGPEGKRTVPFVEFWASPKKGVAGDTVLAESDVIRSILIPARDERQFVGHAEIRQKQAFDWALVTCSVRYETQGGKIKDARVWYGSLAPTPWRAAKAEAALIGQACSDAAAARAADAALADATPLEGTKYKVQLAKVALKRALAAARERR